MFGVAFYTVATSTSATKFSRGFS